MTKFSNKLEKFKSNSPEYIAITLIFWGLFIVVILSSLSRLLGWGFYSKTIEPKDYGFWISLFGNFALKWFESIFIICALTKFKLWHGALVGLLYVTSIYIVNIPKVETILDFVYIIIIPFAFIKFQPINKNIFYIQIGKIAVFLVLLLSYQLAMSFGIYELQINQAMKQNFLYGVISIIPYKLFIVWLYLFFRRKDLCKLKTIKK